MPRPSITLVLGAGSSIWLGYPCGEVFRQRLLELPDKIGLLRSAEVEHRLGELRAFCEAFRGSRALSIDAFLASRADQLEIGKLAISLVLREHEAVNPKLDARDTPRDNWCEYLFSGLLPTRHSALDFRNLNVITFNYDRSFEWLLRETIRYRYNLENDVADSSAKQLEIVHIHGRIGSPFSGDRDYIAYGEPLSGRTIEIASRDLRVIPEQRGAGEHIERARQMLVRADAIVFLGFGFDIANLELLDSQKTCSMTQKQASGGIKIRKIHATCFGLKDAEIEFAARRTSGVRDPQSRDHRSSLFARHNCVDLLRETLILTE